MDQRVRAARRSRASAGEAEAVARPQSGRGLWPPRRRRRPPDARAGAPAEVAANAAAAQSMPWRVLRAHQRAGVDWLSARHLAGVGSIVCDRVPPGAPTVLSHLMHLRDSMGVKGSHLLVCQPETMRQASELTVVPATARGDIAPADEQPRRLSLGGADLIIVPTNVLVEAKAAEAKVAELRGCGGEGCRAPVETDEARRRRMRRAARAAVAGDSSKKSKKKKKSAGAGARAARRTVSRPAHQADVSHRLVTRWATPPRMRSRSSRDRSPTRGSNSAARSSWRGTRSTPAAASSGRRSPSCFPPCLTRLPRLRGRVTMRTTSTWMPRFSSRSGARPAGR